MKALVFLLVLVNVLFYAFSSGYLGRPGNPDAGRLEQQVEPDRMRIVSRGEAPAAKAPLPEPVAPSAAAVVPAGSDEFCLAWGNMASSEADRLGTLLTDKFVEYHVERRNVSREPNGWWVYIPPLANKAEADKKVSELKRIGVSDYFIIQDTTNRFAISLGIFSSEKGANDRLGELKAKGVKSARQVPRSGNENAVTLQVSGPPAGKAALLEAVSQAFPKVEAQACK